MNIGETKKEFKKDCNTEYKIISVEKRHLNVSTITVTIKNCTIIFGYSYNTIVSIALNGYRLVTNEIYSTSTQKHKGQLYESNCESMEINKSVFDYLLNRLLNGENLEIEHIKKLIKENNLKIVRIKDKNDSNVFKFLENNKIINEYGFKDEIKNIIRGKLWRHNKVFIKNNKTMASESLNLVIEKQENGTYKNNIINKEYKNLSFLNNFDLDNIISII
jgi:hypothetical protein